MATFSKRVYVSTPTYGTEPDMEIPFVPKVIRAAQLDDGDFAYVSFDGVTDACVLLNDVRSMSSLMEWRWQMGRKVWLRSGGGSVDMQIIAEA